MGCHQKHKKKTNLYKLKKIPSPKQLFSVSNPFKNCKKQVHKGYPLAGPCICNYKACAIRNNLLGSPVFFSPFFFKLWLHGFKLWLNAFSKHRQSKPLQTQTNYLLQSSCFQSESNEDPIRAYQKKNQSESNGNPIRAYQKREDLPELFQKPWGMVQISSLLLRIYHPPKKKNKTMGGEPLLLSMQH